MAERSSKVWSHETIGWEEKQYLKDKINQQKQSSLSAYLYVYFTYEYFP